MHVVTIAVGGGYSIDRAGLTAFLETLPGLSLVSLDSCPPPQVLVWDAEGQSLDRLPPLPPETALLLLVTDEPPMTLPAGVIGLFSKNEKPEALGIAIRQVSRGDAYLSPSLALALVKRQMEDSSTHEAEISTSLGQTLNTLTDREREVLDLLAEGLSNKAIATRLYLSIRTVEGHLAALYARLGVHSRTEAMRVAIQHRSLRSHNRTE